jgi:hypothetical protein
MARLKSPPGWHRLFGENRWLEVAAWVGVVFLLPLTSFPLVQQLSHSELVAPASIIPLLVLIPIWFLPYLLRRGDIPRQALPIFGFALAALAACAAAFLTETPAFKNFSILPRELQALVTLGVGLTFYLVCATWPRSDERLRLTLQVLNFAGLMIILWSLIQAYFWYGHGHYPSKLNQIQRFFSIKDLYPQRVTGFAYEPSWLAHLLNLSFLSFWLAATLKRYSAHRFRIFFFTFENLLLLGGLVVLALSFSRIGWLAFFLGVAYILLGFHNWLVQRILRWMLHRFTVRLSRLWLLRVGLNLGITLALMIGYTASLVGVAAVASRFDRRIAYLFEPPDPAGGSGIFAIANHLAFAERVIYWATGWEIFNHHPVLGVGLGNAGYYFQQEMPAYGFYLPEINDLFFRLNYLPNTKSLWVRLVAETGLVGLAFFVAWLYVLWQSARFLLHSENRLEQTFGLSGSLTLVILMIEGFSIDSFALPYLWFSLGLLTAAASLRQKKLRAAHVQMVSEAGSLSEAESPSEAESLREKPGGTA